MLGSALFLFAILPTIWIVDASNGPGRTSPTSPTPSRPQRPETRSSCAQGSYSAFAVSGKALTIHGAGAATTIVVNPPPPTAFPYQQTTIANVPAGSAFYVAGLAFSPGVPSPVNLPSNPGIRVLGASSHVVLADVTATGIALAEGTPGLDVSGGAIVTPPAALSQADREPPAREVPAPGSPRALWRPTHRPSRAGARRSRCSP